MVDDSDMPEGSLLAALKAIGIIGSVLFLLALVAPWLIKFASWNARLAERFFQ